MAAEMMLRTFRGGSEGDGHAIVMMGPRKMIF